MPITWKNVGQTVGAGTAADLLRGASRSIEGGLGKLTDAVRNVSDDRQAQYDFKVDENVNRYFDRLQQYDTPEALQAAKDSGELDELVSSFGDNIDRDRIRGAFDEAMVRERDEFTAENEYDLTRAREAAQPLYQQFASLESPEEQASFLEENMDIFQNARMAGDMRQELYQNEAATRARRNEERAETEREWDRKIRGFSAELANSNDLNFYEGREQLRQRAEEADIPPEFANQYVNNYVQDYSSARQLSPEDTEMLEQQSEVANIQLEHDLSVAENALNRTLAENEVHPEEPWNSPQSPDGQEIQAILRGNGITQKGSYEQLQDGWKEAMRFMRFDEDGTRFSDQPRDGDPFEGVPDEIIANRDAILAYAAGHLTPDKWDIGDDNIEGGSSAAASEIMNAIKQFNISRKRQAARENAQNVYEDRVRIARARAQDSVASLESELKLRRGFNRSEDQTESEAAEESTSMWERLWGRMNQQ